ncbi:SMP-30/gluconolactonase/LRE family protein [Pseudoruegeria sp. SHC-113]|uniref:SMP-30/gluconolactonase/LRE family protein n=1 Tax=Pseudoruegeria sp. SHC-113 TaxID=2855439 RepID=UPI0021BAB857|nr:SMP-30/gluconolactonase/LRE family protein [Pseudoruegeria sp. SHC-113]MCT8159955.1 SMP-30/gluconolactonase/LRE family protein [Pseudoruegeria sp. SHC-113]
MTAPLSAPRLLCDAQALCGESPAWDMATQRLWWVDIAAHRLHRRHPETGLWEIWQMPELISAVVCTSCSARPLVALKSGLFRFCAETGALTFLHSPEPGLAGNRLNDCTTDPAGRLLAGTMSEGAKAATGALYLYGQSGPRRLHGGLTVANGIAHAPDGARLYVVDSAAGVILKLAYDAPTGMASAPQVLAQYAPEQGKPDGLCVDAEGAIWVAFWDGARVERLAPDGAVLARYPLPVKRPTSLCFGGPDLQTLFITSARIGLETAGPDGGLFYLKAPAPGLPVTSANWPLSPLA